MNKFALVVASALLLSFGGITLNAQSTIIVVGPPVATDTCPQPAFARIQDAISAASPGTQIYVCSGIYPETLRITKSLTITGQPGAVVAPSAISQDASSISNGSPLAAIISVSGGADVNLSGLAVDGSGVGITGCAPILVGMLYLNASGTIRNNVVKNLQLSPNLNGCQSGLGIFVQSGNQGTSNVEISENRIETYQKNGITANGQDTVVKIDHNVVIGNGPTLGAAQNGIQLGYGATGEVRGNFVISNLWQPCSSATECLYFATGILIEQSEGVTIEDNHVGNAQVPVLVDGDKNIVKVNEVFGAVVLDGIEVYGNDCEVAWNRIFDSDRAAIAVFGNQTSIENNTLVNAPTGILLSSSASQTQMMNNYYFDVITKVANPNPVSMAVASAALVQ